MGQEVKVERYKGEKKLAAGLQEMMRAGWTVQTQSTRKQVFRVLGGFWTRRQIHTVTYVRDPGRVPPRPG